MKTLKKTCAAMAALCLFCSLLGCSARTPADHAAFTEAAKAQNISLTDNLGTEDAECTYQLGTAANGGMVSFYIFHEESDAQANARAKEFYTDTKNGITAMAKSGEHNIDSAAYSKYSVSNGEYNYSVVHMGATVLYTEYLPADKDAVEAVLNAINY